MKILFITSSRLGDAVLSTGLLDYMLKTYPDARVIVACGTLPTTIFEGFPNVEKIIPIKKLPHNRHWLELWKKIAGTSWEMVVDLRNSIVSRLIWAKKRYIFGNHINKNLHKVEQASMVMKLDKIAPPKLYFTEAQINFANSKIPDNSSPVIGIGPAANWIGKTWEAEKFIELVKIIRGENGILPNAKVAVFAAPGEEEQALPVLESVPAPDQIDVIAKGTPGEVAATISRCSLYVGNDSGLMHIAAATGIPTVGLFGPSYPHLYKPWGEHTAYATTPETFDELVNFKGYSPKTLDKTLMSSLQVPTVINVIENLWRRVENAPDPKIQTKNP